MILTAPEVLIVIYRPKTPIHKSTRVYDLNCLASIWCCIENVLLAMTEEELSGVTFVPQHTTGLKNVLGIPIELEIAAIIPFRYRADDARLVNREDIRPEERIHYDTW